MTRSTIRRFAGGVLAAVVLGGTAHATSLIGTYAPNGAILTMTTTTEFLGLTVGAADTLTMNHLLPGIEPFGIGAPHFALAPPTQTIAPVGSSGTPKNPNEATIAAAASYTLGSATTDDVLSFSASGILNAETALNAAGENAAAHILHSAGFTFFVDDSTTNPSAPALDSVVGTILLPDLRALDPAFETLLALFVAQDFGPIATLLASDTGVTPGIEVDILAGHSYTILLAYDALVAYGTDPPFSIGPLDITLRVSEVQVPAPGGLLLFGIGLAICAVRRSRRC